MIQKMGMVLKFYLMSKVFSLKLHYQRHHLSYRFLDVDLGDGCLPPQSPRICVRSTAPYLPDQGFERYQSALKTLLPIRRKLG